MKNNRTQSLEQQPLVSVIMPVFNGERYIEQSIRSILEQTYSNFELIIIDDASTDETSNKLNTLNDCRIQILTNKINLGNYPSRNLGLKIAQGDFLFVMDADDLALPYRIERQLLYMTINPDVGICSSSFRKFGIKGNFIVTYPLDYESLKIHFLENNYCLHPGLSIRKNLFNNPDSYFYNEQFLYASDYDFVSRNFKKIKICNIPEVLMEYRIHESQITSSKFREQQFFADQIRINYLSNIGLFPNDTEKEIHFGLMKQSISAVLSLKDYLNWCNKIISYNTTYRFFENELLIKFLRNKLKSLHKVLATSSRNNIDGQND